MLHLLSHQQPPLPAPPARRSNAQLSRHLSREHLVHLAEVGARDERLARLALDYMSALDWARSDDCGRAMSKAIAKVATAFRIVPRGAAGGWGRASCGWRCPCCMCGAQLKPPALEYCCKGLRCLRRAACGWMSSVAGATMHAAHMGYPSRALTSTSCWSACHPGCNGPSMHGMCR